jgi:uncharacterized protein YndB with AHSA1/START domain
MKKALKIGGLVIGLLLLLVLGGGLLLKPEYRVERSLLVKAPAERIYAELDSAAGWQRWSVWYRRDPALQQTVSGPAQGMGARWAWVSKTEGNGSLTLTAAEPQRRIAYTLQIEDFAPSTGELRLEPEGEGTRVIWLMQGSMGGNPIARWMGLFLDRMVGPDFEAGLANLQQLTEAKAS